MIGMTTEEKYLYDIGAFQCEQRSPHHIYTVGDHTASVVRYCVDHGASDELIQAAWLHDVGKIKTKTFDGVHDHFKNHPEVSAEIAKKLGASEYVVKLVLHHDAALGRSSVTIRELASNGREWCTDLAILLMADLSGQHPTYQMGEKLQQRGIFLQKLFAELDHLTSIHEDHKEIT